MKRTHNRVITDTFREIKTTLNRFLSILILSALAAGFLAGLRTTAPDMERSADYYYDKYHLMDIRVLSTLGLTDEDVAALAGQPGVAQAEGSYTADAIANVNGVDLIVKLHSLSTQNINTPRLLSGRMPQAADECLAEAQFLKMTGAKLGDSISLDTGTGDYKDALASNKVTVVGTADFPIYINVERGNSTLGTGKVSAFLLLPKTSFTLDYYTEAYLLADGAADLLCYDDDYKTLSDNLEDQLKPLGERRAGLRYDQVIGEATDKLNDAQKEYDDAEAEANKKLIDAEAELKDARRKLDDGWADYFDGVQTLDKETRDNQKKLDDAYTDLVDGEKKYADGVIKLQDGWADYYDGKKKYEDGVADYNEGLKKLEDGEDDYNDALKTLKDGEADYADGLEEYNDGVKKLEDSAKQLADAKEQLEEAEEKLFDGKQQYSEGAQQYTGQVNALSGLLTPILASSGYYAGTTSDELVDRMNDPSWQATDWAVIDGTRASLATLSAAGYATPEQQAALYALNTYFPDQTAYLTMAATLKAGRDQLTDAQDSLHWGQEAIESGWDEYEQGQKDFMEGTKKLQENYPELQDARRKLDDGWKQLEDARDELDDGWDDLNGAKNTLQESKTKLDDAYTELTDNQKKLEDSRKELDDGWVEYKEGKRTFTEEISDAKTDLKDAYQELTDGEKDYADGLSEYEDAKKEADVKLSDARQKLADARRKISDMDKCKWYILGRDTNVGYVSFQQDAERMGNLASVFPLIFFLVAALVCLTTMTRMVEEQRIQIGGMKALGYGKGAIAFKYVGYALFSSLSGSILGLAVGCTLLPAIIYYAWGILYTLDKLIIPLYPAVSILSALAAVGIVTIAALASCFSSLSSVPAELMRPKAPPMGKRVLLERVVPLWRRLSFIHKVTVRNLFRYKKRFLMTAIGIGGCTALIVTGFGLRDSIFGLMDKQYDDIYSYTAQVGLLDDVTTDEIADITKALDKTDGVRDWMMCSQVAISAESQKRTLDCSLMTVSDRGRFEEFVHFRHRLDSGPVVLPDDGVVLTEKLASLLDVGVGDTVTLSGDERVSARVADITENYIMHYVYLSDTYYETLFGKRPAENLILAAYDEDSQEICDTVASKLVPLSGVTSVSRISDTRRTYTSSMESVDYAVIVIIVSAAALAFVVLYNLTNINITERRRELATLKVLGFYDREVSTYIYRENMVLTLFGICLGLVMGKYLHGWLVLTVEIDMLMFIRNAQPKSYLYAVLLTVLFSLLVNVAAYFRLKKIDMVESLKILE